MQVVDDGRVRALGAGRETRLLACLLLHANEVVSRDRLIDAVWGERPPATAPNALRVQVHALRGRLGQERIATEGPGYRLHVEPGELDVERFEQLVARGRSELAAGDADAAASTLREGLALWRGDALVDVAYESFAQNEIARLEDLQLVAREERVEADLALARHAELVPELEAFVSTYPFRERMHGQLMLALYRAGRQSDALAVFRRARRALLDELGLEPGPGLRELQQAILRQDRALDVESPDLRQRRHLPAAPARLLGRRRELEEVGTLLRTAGARLVTLTGPGGTGKTRLALEAAHELAAAFADGVYFVDLSQLREPALVCPTIAHVLGIEERADEPLDGALPSYLRSRRLLLLLDNFEAVVEAAPALGDLLRDAPDLALLVTSRVPLRLSAEHEYRVAPLPLTDAAHLFTIRARAVAPSFRRPSEEAEEVAEICRRLDCLPLAIELAAGRTREYSPAEMLELLPNPLDLADDGPLDLPARQRTLRSAIDWSYERLPADEQSVVMRLAVFAGGCTQAAAEAVCGAGRGALASLVGRNLLVERLGGDGALRFSMLDTIREYALEQLESSGEASAVRHLHADFFLALAATAKPHLVGHGQTEWLARLEAERDNLRAVLAWALEAGKPEPMLKLAVDLERFWWVRGPAEGLSWLKRGLEAGSAGPVLRAAALEAAGATSWFVGDHARAERLFSEAIIVYRRLGDRAGEARILNRLGPPLKVAGKHDEADRLVRAALAIHRELGDLPETVLSLEILGSSALERGDLTTGIALLEESVLLAREIGDLNTVAYDLTNLAEAALALGDPRRAAMLAREALTLARDLGDELLTVIGLSTLAVIAAADDDPRSAGRLWGAAEQLADALGPTMWDRERRRHDEMLGERGPEFEKGRDEGCALPVDHTIRAALAGELPAAPEADELAWSEADARPSID